MPREPLFTGMSDKVWKKESSLRPEKIWLPLKKTTKKSELKLLKDKVRKKADRSFIYFHPNIYFQTKSLNKFMYDT